MKILDFGLAKMSVGTRPNLRTRSDAILGTPVYMSPEQCRAASEVDAKTDVYALGVMLYEAMTARPPFVAAGPGELMAMHIYEEPRRPQSWEPSIPSSLDALIRVMLAKGASERPTMAAVAQRLAVVIEQLDEQSAAAASGRHAPRWWPGGAGLLFLALAGTGMLYLKGAVSRRAPLFATPTPVPPDVSLAPPLTPSRATPPGMVLLPGGSFIMGSTTEEMDAAYEFCHRLSGELCQRDYYKREQPQRPVAVSAFYLDATEITNAQFAAWLNAQRGVQVESGRLVKEGPLLLADLYPAYGYSGLRYQPLAAAAPDDGGKTATLTATAPAAAASTGGQFAARPGLAHKPVVQVSWHAALRYCNAQGGRLPTEAEWELAARGPQGYRFPWGDDEPSCEGVVYGRLRGESCANSGVGPMAVGHATQDVTRDGVRDLGGNVSEWVMDVLQIPYPACALPCRDPVSLPHGPVAELGAARVVRGGNWYQSAESCRAAGRSRLPGNQLKGNIGFRCARPVSSQ